MGLENLKPKNPRHPKVSRSFPTVLTLPGLPALPFQVWLGNCNLGLNSALSSPVPHGKWLCPQHTDYTSVWFLGETWPVCVKAQANSVLLSDCLAKLHPQWASVPGMESVGTLQPLGSPSVNLIAPHCNYTGTLFISYLGKQSM